jgi:propionyl-CoA carboxylase alpha chain
VTAIDLQADALDAFYLDGIGHNIPFLAALMQHPRWRSGELSTGFIAEEFPDGFVPRDPDANEVRVLAAVAAAIDHLNNTRRRAITDQMDGPEVRFVVDRVAHVGDVATPVQVASMEAGKTHVRFADGDSGAATEMVVESDWWPGQPVWNGTVDGKVAAIQVRPILNGYRLDYRGLQAATYVYTPREAELAALMPVKEAPDLSRFLLCPMPGLVKSISVSVGDTVNAGETLAVVEAMKMENVLRAERDAVVKAIKAEPGDSLAVDAVIIEFEES